MQVPAAALPAASCLSGRPWSRPEHRPCQAGDHLPGQPEVSFPTVL